jgi:hypothetical protein
MNKKFVYQVGNNKKVILWCTANQISSTKYHIHTVCFSWWLAHSRPKHVEIDKYTKNNCLQIWLYLQDYNTGLDMAIATQSNVIFQAVRVITICQLIPCHIPEYFICSSQNCFHEVANGEINSVKPCFALILTLLLPEILKNNAHNFINLAALCMGTRCVPLILRQAYYCEMFENRLSLT